jgi:hypothetical protein
VGSEGDFEGVMMSRSREILPSEKLVGRWQCCSLQPNHHSTCKDLITGISLAKEPKFEIAARPHRAPHGGDNTVYIWQYGLHPCMFVLYFNLKEKILFQWSRNNCRLKASIICRSPLSRGRSSAESICRDSGRSVTPKLQARCSIETFAKVGMVEECM